LDQAVQPIKIHIINLDSTEDREVSVEEAQRIVEDSWAQGMTAIDRKTGNVIDKVTADIRDILIIIVIDGG
jgi:hypothetical protein